MDEKNMEKFNVYLNGQTLDKYSECLVKLDTTDISRKLTSSFGSIVSNQLEKCKTNRTESSKYLLGDLKTKMFMKSEAILEFADILAPQENFESDLMTTAVQDLNHDYLVEINGFRVKEEPVEQVPIQLSAWSSTSQQLDQDQSQILNERDLARHMATHTGKQQYSCGQCEKKFTNSRDLKRHMRTNTGEMPYSCYQCQKKFNQPSNLKTHMMVHTGERRYSCDHCEKKFFQLIHLKQHVRTHTGEKPYSCGQCQKKFSLSGNLKAHLFTHTKEKPYSCGQCEKKFIRSGQLKTHRLTH
jgi:uncharacterized Zn-finger protein